MAIPGYILLVEHSPNHMVLLQSMLQAPLEQATPVFHFSGVHGVQTLEAALQVLDADHNCAAVLLDLDLLNPASLRAIHARAPDPPVLALVNADSGASGLNAVLVGAQDYLVRDQLDNAVLMRALQFAHHRVQVEAALVERALRDPLTGLPSRLLLLDRLGVAMKRCTRDGSSGALLLIQLDALEAVGKPSGYLERDAMLRIAGSRLSAVVRVSDTVACLDGYELAVLLHKESGLLEALSVGDKLLGAVREPLPAVHGSIQLSAAVGMVRFKDATESPDGMLQRAQQAMAALGKDSKGRVRLL